MPDNQEQLARSQEALARVQALAREARIRIEQDRIAREAEIKAAAEIRHKEAEARLADIREQQAHQPRRVDSVNDITYTSGGMPTSARLLNKMDDGYGNTVYTAYGKGDPIVRLDEIKPLSDRILAQQASFGTLGDQDRSRIQSEFDTSNGRAEGARPYRDYLNNQALGKRFEELKAKSPGPPKPR